MEYVTIRTVTLRGDQKITFDVYMPLGPKYIVYVRKGDSFDGVRLERLKSKNMKKLYIRPEEEQAYRDYVSLNIDMAYDKKDKPIEDRAEIIHGSQQANTEAVMEQPENQLAYAQAKEGASRYVDFLIKEQQAVRAMLNIENVDRNLSHHGVAVSTLAVLLGNKLGIEASRVELMALGALLHDFGHAKSTMPLLKPLSDFDAKGKIEYMKHAMGGAESVRIHRHFDEVVVKIIAEHEELIDGSGYPNKLTEKKSDPLSVIVSTANAFDRMMLNEKLARADASKKFTMDRVGLHPLEHFKLLKSL